MALTKSQELLITILNDGILEVRQTVKAFDDDGSLIGERHHRGTFTPNMALADLPAGRVRQVANTVWTQAVIDAYIAKQAAIDAL